LIFSLVNDATALTPLVECSETARSLPLPVL
jgi:hypothetical protein